MPTAATRPCPSPTVTTATGGRILGKTQPAVPEQYPRAVDAFYGVPYARVPLRFRAAVPLSPESLSRFDASTPGRGRQPMYGAVVSSAAEKTLTLNIFRHSSTPGGKRVPVVVYVHGGGFNFGEPLERDHVAFVSWSGREIVVVSVCYRLGVLGFTPGGGKGRELNLGLKDQRLALEWVKEHIGIFGGDGEDITFMGVSAGAHSIGHHILDPRGPLLFGKAILESGAATARSVLAATHPRTRAQLASLEANGTDRKTLETLDVEGVLDANMAVWADNAAAVTWPFQPVIEENPSSDAVIPATPLQLWEQFAERMASAPQHQQQQPLAVITGFCSHEGTSFVPGLAATNAEFRAFFATLIPGFSAQDLDRLELLYPDPVADPASPYRNDAAACRGKGAQYTRLHEAYAHYAYICPVLHTAHKLSAIAAAAALPSRALIRVYVYEYAALSGRCPAAGHGDQASVVAHDAVQLHGLPGLAGVAEAMHARWTAFVAGALGEDSWPAFETPFGGGNGEGRMLVFGRGNGERVPGGWREEGVAVTERTVTESEKRQCEFWWARMGLSQGHGV
ncbi:Carboxylesterase, type B [Akanthomyces lecanii RCEF 1005]|uniref:Carboxylesterase, type B n=1 Tax=Akanthomyces lecanii RCEF 1005 TaxID=1081108 RepID=A0A168G678_CORDF|nr:Carboxylesterase, type B [Akanthomyces lecanii RCEF 1005]